jgi:hypothetical protein
MCAFRFLVLVIAATSGVLFAPAVASAHAMHARVEVRTDCIYVLTYFDEDLPAEFATVSVADASGTEFLTGKTDEHGEWTFAKPAPGEYKLTVRSVGHVARREFRVDRDPEAAPVVFTGWQMNRAIGISVGLGLLLGISAISWFIRRQRRG